MQMTAVSVGAKGKIEFRPKTRPNAAKSARKQSMACGDSAWNFTVSGSLLAGLEAKGVGEVLTGLGPRVWGLPMGS